MRDDCLYKNIGQWQVNFKRMIDKLSEVRSDTGLMLRDEVVHNDEQYRCQDQG
jgi:hypothetical protein